MNKKLLTILLSVLLPAFLVSAVVYATTSVGDAVSIGTTLTVTGATTLNGNVTLGDEATDTVTIDGPVTLGGTTATGLTFTGGYATAAIQLGTSASKMLFAAADDHAIDVWTTNAQTSGTVRSVDISQTHTGAGAIAEALASTLTSNVAIGSWGNAIYGKVDLSTNGYTTGQIGVICAELTFPGSTAASAGGDYVLYQAEIILPASADMGTRPIHVLDVHAQGTQKAQFDTVGYLFEVGGVTPAAGKLVSLASQTIRTKIETASPVADLTRYLVLSQMEDGLGLGVTGTPMAITASTKAVDIYTTSGATTGTVRSMAINQVQSAASAVTILEAFRVNIESEYMTGDWANAIVGRIDYGTTGNANGGTAAAISAEMQLPNGSMSGGEYSALALEMGTAASTVFHANAAYPYAFIKMNIWGGSESEMDDHGYLINVKGLTAGADDLVSLTSQTLKSRIAELDRYIVLSQMQDGLGLGVTGTPMAITASTKAVDIYTTSGATTGTVRSMAINQVQSVDARSVILEAFRVNVASAYETGDWTNAIVGRIDYTGGGNAAGGMAAAISAEIMFPDESMTSMGGEYNALALEMGMGASTAFHENSAYPYSFLKFSTWGGTEMDDHGYLFYIDGITAGAGGLVSANSQTLKARIGTADRYLVMSQAENGLTLSGATGGINVTNTALASGAYNSAIKSVSTLVAGGTSEGIAGYFEGHLAGAYSGKLLYGVGAWINLDATANLTGGTVRALDVGIWANDSNVTAESTEFVGINVDMHFDISDDAATIYPLRFNTTQAGANPDGWFRAANHEAIASTPTPGAYSTADGYITVNIAGTTYRMPYYLAVD